MSENLFEKLNKQSETIDQVAEKLDGVSITDLYALAKRTWDYRDYEMAQKYYNHISLLSPLEWEAPFRASLCGCLGVEQVGLWDRRPKTIVEYYQSTIKYIHSRDLSQEQKIQAFIQATEIIVDVIREYIRIYLIPDNRESFDAHAPAFKRNIQKAFVAILKTIDEYAYEEALQIKESICKELAEFIELHCQGDKSIAISKEDFEIFVYPYNNRIEYTENIFEEINAENEKEIKLKGKCYLVYKDKVVEKRYRRKNVVFGSLLIVASIVNMLLNCNKQLVPSLISSSVALFIGIIMLIRGFGRKKGILQNSWMNINRWGYRLTSGENVIHERKFSLVRVIAVFAIYGFVFNLIFSGLSVWGSEYKIYESIILVSCFIIELVGSIIFGVSSEDKYDCSQRIEYQGKTYLF
jgi:hypothetical protein